MNPNWLLLMAVAVLPQAASAQVHAPAFDIVLDEVAVSTGALSDSFGRGVAAVDLDDDGRLDLVCANHGDANIVMRQELDGTFTVMNTAWGLPFDSDGAYGVLAADFDNDKDVDLYIPAGGTNWERNSFWRNDLDTTGKFTSMANSSGAAGTVVGPCFGGTVLDYDRDGDLDIFLSNAEPFDNPLVPDPTCTLLRNEGNGVFTDVSAAAGIVELGDWRHCGAGDYDNDGWPDIAVSRFDDVPGLYHNNGDGTFTETAVAAGVTDTRRNFGMTFADFDNDGWLDIYNPKFQIFPTRGDALYHNNGDGTFTDISVSAGMVGNDVMGHGVGDLNMDGFLDIMIGTGNPYYASPDVLLLNDSVAAGALQFVDATVAAGLDALGVTRCHGVIFADLDRDGKTDLYLNHGGTPGAPATAQENGQYMSRGNGNRGIGLELFGTESSRTPVGARIRLVLADGSSIYRDIQVGTGFCNTGPRVEWIGIGAAEVVERIEIRWPLGLTQTLCGLEAQGVFRVAESGLRVTGNFTPGGDLTVHCCGQPRADVGLWLSETLYTVPPLHGIGEMLIAPPYRNMPALRIGDQGTFSKTFPLPLDPLLIGTTWHLQAVMSGPMGVFPTDASSFTIL